MQVIDTKIADVKIIQPTVFGDPRGFSSKRLKKNAISRC